MSRPPATPPTRPRRGQYAFWSYDKFPYFLGGKIIATRANPYRGATNNDPPFLVQTEGYGGAWFPARVILPPKLGEKVLELRGEMHGERREFNATANEYWRWRLNRELEGEVMHAPEIMERIVDA